MRKLTHLRNDFVSELAFCVHKLPNCLLLTYLSVVIDVSVILFEDTYRRALL